MRSLTDRQRRRLLKQGLSAAVLTMLAGTGLLLPRRVLAHWPREAFTAETVEDALRALMGEAEPVEDEAISFTVGSPPTYAVNGAAVPVEIQTTLENIERIAIVVDKNPAPLAMSIEPGPAMRPPFKTMIKMAEDSDVYAIVRANNKLYQTQRFVEVDIGGCA